MITIESRQNSALRHLARLGRERKYRRSTEEMLCEGEKMLEEALRSGVQPGVLLVRERARDSLPDGLLERAAQAGAALYCASDALFELASDVETPQNVIFSCKQPHWTADALDGKAQVLLLDGLQDPGNLGTILRTAEAFALGAVVLCEGCADPFSPKVVRSTMGAVFRLPCVRLPLTEASRAAARAGAGGLCNRAACGQCAAGHGAAGSCGGHHRQRRAWRNAAGNHAQRPARDHPDARARRVAQRRRCGGDCDL